MAELKDVIDTLDNAADSFDGIATKEQKKIYDEVVSLAKDLKTKNGKVIQSIENLKLLTKIKAHLAALSKDKEWVAGITQFAQYFGHLQKMQNEYYSQHFTESTLGMDFKKKNELMRKMAVQNTMEALMGDGLKANVTDKLNDILLRAVTSGSKFADLQHELHAHLMGENGGKGAFARYATTYATTALSQFAGQHNKLVTDDLGLEWFMYTGSNKETTREFCEHLTEKKYIHKSEIPTILTGKIDDHQCAIYDKTGLPLGMIAGTTPENFQCNCGGWNCRHQLVPVHELAVPANIRAKFKQIIPTATAQPQPKQQPIDLAPYQEQVGAIEQYIAEHPGSKKLKLYLDNAHKMAENGDESELNALLKAAIADMNKFNAAAKSVAKKKDAKKAQEEFNKALQPLKADIDTIKQYTIEHPKSSKLAKYLEDIQEEIAKNDIEAIPYTTALIQAAIKDIKKFNAAAKSKDKKNADQNNADYSLPETKKSYDQDKVKEAQKAVDKTIQTWLKKFNYKDWASAPADHKKGKLEYEINWLISNKDKYDTWEIAKNIYQKMLADVEEDLMFVRVKTALNEIKGYKAKSTAFAKNIKLAEKEIDAGHINKAFSYIEAAKQIKYKEEAGKSKIVPPTSKNNKKQNEHIKDSRHFTEKEKINKIIELTGVNKTKAEDWFSAVKGFSFEWDYEIRAAQNGREVTSKYGHTKEQILKKAQDIEDFVASSPKWSGSTLYRGIALTQVEETRKKLKAGVEDMLGGSSWSTSEDKAKQFARMNSGKEKVIFICKNMKNATSIQYLSEIWYEYEVYASMKNRYKLIKETKDDGFTYFEVSCI